MPFRSIGHHPVASFFLTTYNFGEVHTTTVQAAPERIFGAIKTITPGEIQHFRAMFAVRALPALFLHRRGGIPFGGKEPLLRQVQRGRFIVLAEEPNQELVVGAIGQFWQIRRFARGIFSRISTV